MLTRIYRKYVPESFRDKIYEAFLGQFLSFSRNFKENTKSTFIYLFKNILPKTISNELYAFMGKHGLSPYPYEYALMYKNIPIDVQWNEVLEMPYVFHSDKKLYFPKNYDKKRAESTYRALLIEQDNRSAHQYLTNIERLRNKTILDMGAAEGFFTLNAIEIINRAYLFECEEEWIIALNATFAPWQDKVTIIQKYVNDTDDENNITIDSFLAGKEKNNLFFKMDIEGCEQSALKGAIKTLQEAKDLDYSICTYHHKNDAVEIEQILKKQGFQSEFSEGFLYFEKEFRTAIIRKAN